MTQSIQQTDSRAQKWPPLVCICSLCECGGHKCSDFNDRPLERNGNNSTTPLGDDGGNYDERLCRSQSHSCSYTQGAAGQLEERYLTRTGAPPGQQQRKQQQQQQHLSRPKRSPSVGDDARNDSSKGNRATPVSSRASQTGPGLEDEADVLHVLVTRPQVASKPRDNIIFEGDMDLRTTFETSYEALARARLEHWKRHQELKARRQRLETPDERRRQDVSDIMAGNDSRQQAATTFSRGNEEAGFEGRSSSLAGQQLRGARVARDDDYDDDDHDADRHYGRTMGGAQFVSDVEGRGAAGFAGFGAGFGGAGAHNHDHGGGPIDSRELDPLRNTYGTARNKRAAPANVSTINAPNNRNVSGAADQSAESKQQRRPLVFGPALSLETADPGGRRRQAAGSTSPNQPELAPLTTGQRKQQQHRRQQDHFIDPDLSPIIVYDANLNRLERVGLRKRSKYRPSTSLRPGGGGFFGPVDDGGEGANKSGSGPGGAAATPDPGKQIKPDDRCHERAAREKRGANSRLELADQNRPENEGLERAHEEEEAVTADDGPLEGRHHQHHDETTRAAAGATSETLNRAQNDCGRKHHLAHVNRIDHIKQMNLVEGSHSPELTTTTTTKSGGGGDNTQLAGWQGDNNETEAVDNRRARLKLTENGHGQHRTTNTDYDDHEDHDHDRRLAFEEEEAAAVAEIQRLVVDDSGEYRVAHRVEPSHLAGDGTGQRAPSRQSPTNKFIRQTTIASPSEAALVSRAQDNSPALPGKVSADGRRSSSRHSRMERVCQNQSFYLFENDYPETRNGALDDKRCIKIGGGRESVELAKRTQHGPAAVSPQSAHVRQNLFRESPDFIMTTTGHTRARLLKSGQENENSEDNKGYDGQRDQRQQFNATPEHNDAQVQRQQQHAEANILNQISDQFFDRGGTGATGSPGDHPCRVLNLRNEFEFVGSRSGHKYFVEKHRLASPLGEVG